VLVIATHGDSCGIGGGGERESSQGSQGSDDHELRGKKDHFVQLGMKRSYMRPVAEMKQ
jgi:hypothetical protein